ncbi:hypothetical protein AB0H83_44055 [Dactylosporangium sp. NPDC050688]|uniref:hypothetical protein n=1 Tax=Dactylosporangium sp. NPDC050688 TaxID=3157217 RepID=UPI0033C4DE18
MVDEIASTADTFEALLRAIESADPDAVPEDLPDSEALDELVEMAEDDFSFTEGLDIGVAGLVYALTMVDTCHAMEAASGGATRSVKVIEAGEVGNGVVPVRQS